MTTISGKIYQQTNAAGTENRFPRTVIEAVYGLSSYLQTQFGNLANIYMPIEGISESKTDQEFVYRITPNTINAKSFTLDRIKGNTLVWNQRAKNGNFAAGTDGWVNSGGTFTASNNVATLIWTSQYVNNGAWQTTESFTAGHKFYVAATIKNLKDSERRYFVGQSYGVSIIAAFAANEKKRLSGILDIITGSGTGYGYLCIGGSANVENSIELTNVVCFDLTRMFGAGDEPSTVAEFEALFPLPYYAYNAGEIINNKVTAIQTVGFNQWDEETRLGYYNANGEWEYVNTIMSDKNGIKVFPDTSYYIHYGGNASGVGIAITEWDAAGNFIKRTPAVQNQIYTTSPNCAMLHFNANNTYGSTYNHDICINLSDPAKNGTYEPYRKSTMQLGLDSIRVKSPNIWDEEWELGVINLVNGAFVDSTTEIRSKNLIPIFPGVVHHMKASYIRVAFYDKAGNFLEAIASNLTDYDFTSPSNAYYMAFYVSGTTYNNDICINISNPAFDGRYFPHGILTFSGLNGTNDVYDECTQTKNRRRFGVVDMGTLNWFYFDNYSVFAAAVPGGKINTDGIMKNNVICRNYTTYYGDGAWNNMPDKAVGYGLPIIGPNLSCIAVHDSDYTDAAAFKAAMSGVGLVFELANEEVYDLAEPLVMTMRAGTTEEAISPNADGISAPFCCDMTYSASENNDSAYSQYAAFAGRLINTYKLWGQDFNGEQDVSGNMTGVGTINGLNLPPTLSGTLARIEDNVASATKLQTSRNIWGQSFNGTSAISGNMSSVGNIAFSDSGKNIGGLLYFDTTNSRLGVGAAPGSYKLDVSGSFHANGAVTLSDVLTVAGNTELSGTLQVGTSSVNKATTLYGTLTVSGLLTAGNNIVPSSATQDLGTSSQKWRDLYLSRNAYIGGYIDMPINTSIRFDDENGYISYNENGYEGELVIGNDNGTILFDTTAANQGGIIFDTQQIRSYADILNDGYRSLGTNNTHWVNLYCNRWYPNANDTTHYIEWDSTNSAFKIVGDVYATGQVAGGGIISNS